MRPLLLLGLALAVAACDSAGGAVVEADSVVTMAFEGRLENGAVFTEAASAEVDLSNDVIPGFRDGVVGMQVGESRTFEVPPEAAYGTEGRRDGQTGALIVPPNATLTFDVTVWEIE